MSSRILINLRRFGLVGWCFLLAAGCRHAPPSAEPPATTAADHEPLPASDPLAFLEKCLERYDRDNIQGYRLLMHKQEQVGGELQPLEVVGVCFRAHPYSVYMRWLEGARRAASVLYVQGQNDDKILVHPTGLVGTFVKELAIDPNGAEARNAGRYRITDFGLKKTLERTVKDWKEAQAEGTLQVKYVGVRKVPELGDRPCYTLHRTLPEPDPSGFSEVTIFIDQATWFQTGTVLEARDGTLLAKYLYLDIEINPTFPPGQFQPSVLRQ